MMSEIKPAAVVVLVALASFGLGRLSAEKDKKMPITVTQTQPAAVFEVGTGELAPPEAGYVGSRNGSKYHLPWCAGAQRILEANKIWFASKEEAEAKGYTPAANCEGI